MVYPSESFDPLRTLEVVEAERCDVLYGVPTMFIAQLNHPEFSRFDLSSLRRGIMAGAPCPIEVMNEVASTMHMSEITIAYGMTETSPVNVAWADFSDWLVTAGVILGYAALVVALIEVFLLRTRRLYRPPWPFALGMIAALILATFDMLVHTRDAWTSVVPWGLVLSTVIVVVIVASWVARATYQLASPKVTG
jgi:acyl-CoA synthetase (AMP-forming)/AMP-acid ligase II